jgi:hypothetical protein
LDVDTIDHSLDEAINSTDEDYIMRAIRQNYLSISTVTIHLIGLHSAENRGAYEQRFIKRELQASLYNGQGNTRSGILGVVLPSMTSSIYRGEYQCSGCNNMIGYVKIDDETVVREFSYNYYIPNSNCHWTEDERYCVLTTWDLFIVNPELYIEQAFAKRASDLSQKVKVRP